MKTRSKDVAAYIAGHPPDVRRVLTRVRSIIRKTVPDAEEMISYQIPAYKLHRRPVLFFAGWKEHYSLYPSNARLVSAFKDKLAGYELSKGTIRFPLTEPIPAKLIADIARFRAKEIIAAERAKSASRKTAARKTGARKKR